MLGKTTNYLVMFTIIAAMLCGAAWAGSSPYDACSGQNLAAGYKGISKVKPSATQVLKVKPYSGISAGFGAISSLNPLGWWRGCCLPMPARRQFVLGPRVFFARLTGEVQKGGTLAAATTPSLVNFDDHLGLPKSGNAIWTIAAHYQVMPRWGLRYSFTPIQMEATSVPESSFEFMDRTFTANSNVRTKWERYEHRAGIVFNLSRTRSGVTSVFADWMLIQDKITIGDMTGAATAVTWDDDKSMAVLGLEFNKCLKNYRGNTLALSCKGGVAFLDDNMGYDAEAALNYMIPVKRGRFGFIKGGYRYASLKKERDIEKFATTMDGAFVEVGFLF